MNRRRLVSECFLKRALVRLSLIHISEPTRRTPISYAVFNKKVTTKGSSQELDEDSKQSSIKRNYAIALVAKSLHSAAHASNDQSNKKAAKLIQNGIKKATSIVSQRNDKNLKRIIKIAQDYQENLQ